MTVLDRGGVDDPDLITEQTGRGGQVNHEVPGHAGEVASAFVVNGLLRDREKCPGQVLTGEADEAL